MTLVRPQPGQRYGGRKKGTPNKVTSQVKAALEKCYKKIGGDAEFSEWAKNNRTEFYKLWSKMLPKDVRLGDPDGKKLEPIRIIRIVAPAPAVPLNGHA